MATKIHHTLKALGLSLLLGTGTLSYAADPITDAMQTTNKTYRVALFKTNSNAQAEALQALTLAQQSWDKLAAQFSARPVPPYAQDAEFASSVTNVSKIFSTALAQINANDLSGAHATLEETREVMANMRQRNQVVVFSDHMNAYHR